MQPLADRIRPLSLEELFGQDHITAKGKILNTVVATGNVPNMVFYGPSGTGKTTAANIVANACNMKLYKLNATNASISDIRNVIENVGALDTSNGILLYLDEIQYFNKKQQQSLLEVIENGSVTLIAATTENPYFYVYNAILSRATVVEFKPLEITSLCSLLKRAIAIVSEQTGSIIQCDEAVLEFIARGVNGDGRKGINTIELLTLNTLAEETVTITMEAAKELTQRSNMRYDRDGDMHYDILSAFQKSIRGSDENAALHYLARLLEAGDLISASRRLLVMASEDIGLAYPTAVLIVKSCVDSALQLGLPEARIPLAEATILLATAPKSNSVICAIDAAMNDVKAGNSGDIPNVLKDAHYLGAEKFGHGVSYQYPHNFKNHYVKQQYLPDVIKNTIYYEFGDNKIELAAKNYWEMVKKDNEV